MSERVLAGGGEGIDRVIIDALPRLRNRRFLLLVRVALWLCAIAPVAVYLGYRISHLHPSLVDWRTYVQGADALLAGRSPYPQFELSGAYRYSQAADGLGYVYPPSAAVLMAPFLHPAKLWIGLNAALYLSGVAAIVWRRGPLAVGVALWAAILPHALWDGLGGTVSPGLAGALGLVYAGVPLAGLAGALKLYPLAWAAMPAREGFRRAALVTALALGIPVVVSVVLAGVGPWFDYFSALRNAQPDCGLAPFALPCSGVPQPALWVAGVLLGLAALRLPREWALLALGAVPIVAAPEVWTHYWVTLVPGIVAIAFVGWDGILGRLRSSAPPVLARLRST